MRTRAKLAGLVAAACLLVGGLTVANAAQLSVDGGHVATASAGPCATALTAQATGAQGSSWNRRYRSLTFDLSGAPACQGRPIDVTVTDSYDDSVVAHGSSASPSGASPVVTMDGNSTFRESYVHWFILSYDAEFHVTVGGWLIPVAVDF